VGEATGKDTTEHAFCVVGVVMDNRPEVPGGGVRRRGGRRGEKTDRASHLPEGEFMEEEQGRAGDGVRREDARPGESWQKIIIKTQPPGSFRDTPPAFLGRICRCRNARRRQAQNTRHRILPAPPPPRMLFVSRRPQPARPRAPRGHGRRQQTRRGTRSGYRRPAGRAGQTGA
jgi:hypothetical protein